MDVVGARRRQPPQAALFEARRCKQLIDGSPLKLDKIGYFNSLLFPLAVAERLASKLRGKDECDVTLAASAAQLRVSRRSSRRNVTWSAACPCRPALSLFAVASAR